MRTFFFFFLLNLVSSASGSLTSEILNDIKEHWGRYKETHKLRFHPGEDSHRMSLFHENVKYIHVENEKGLGYKLGLNHLLHLKDHELQQYRGFRPYRRKERVSHPFTSKFNLPVIDMDWREKGIISEVKDQGACGSCWAFSAVGALEAYYSQSSGVQVLLSEQDLVDCSSSYGNHGCSGGWQDSAFDYVKDRGLNSASSYPYNAKEGDCKHDNRTSVLRVTGFQDLDVNNETELAAVVSNYGPVSVAIDASLKSFHFYQSGIYYDKNCSSTNVDHAVLVVGIGSTPAPHYIVKNSWGTRWGDAGYVKIARDMENMCGIAGHASFPSVEKVQSDL